MTRKKSNVKALALAVTCAILAGGYSGLNPVYAADTLYKEGANVTTSSNSSTTPTSPNIEITELTVGGVTIGGGGKISGTSITLSGASEFNGVSKFGGATTFSAAATFNAQSTFSAGILANTISEATGGNGVTVGGVTFKNNNINTTGTITVSKLALSVGTHNLEDVGEAIDTNKANIAANTNKIDTKADKTDLNTANDEINALKEKTRNFDSDGITLTNMDEVGATKVSATTLEVGGKVINAAKVEGYDAAVSKTANITQNTDGSTTVDGVTFKAGAVSGVSGINDDIIKFSKNGTKDIVQINSDLMFNDDAGRQAATLTLEGVKTLNGLSNGSSKIKADDGSVVGGVKFDNKNITDVDSVMVNKDANNQVQINSEGIVVGLHSTVIGSDGVYAGGHTATTAKAVLGADGSIKGAGDGAGKYKFKVTNAGDVFSSSVTATLGGFNDVLINNGLAVGSAGGPNVAIGGGGIIATNGTDTVTVGNGAIVATGDITANGALSGASLATTGDITGANITASGALNGDSLNVNNDAAIGGKLDVTGNIQGADITATGALKGGSLNVTNDAAVGGNLAVAKNIKGQSLNIGATGTEFTVDTVGHMTSKSAQIGSVGITNTGVITGVTSLTTGALTVTGAFTTGGNLTVTGDLEASGAIKGKTISIIDGGSIAGVSFATGGNLTAATGTIAGVSFATGGNVSGVHDLTASGTIQGATLKVNDNNLLDNNGLKAEKAVIDSVVIDDASITSTGAKGLDVEKVNLKNGAITADKATIGGVNTLDNTGINVATGSTIQVGVNTKIEDGSIAVSTNTTLTDQALNLNAANKWTAAGGLEADKATVNGVVLGADATKGKATFTDAAGKVTTIAGDKITTGTITADELLVDSISLGKDPTNKNITIGSNGDIKTNGDVTVTGADGDTTVIDGAQATFGKDAMNQTIINKGDISATAKNAADAQQSTLTHNNKGFKVAGKDAGGTKASSFGFDTSTGIGTFTGQDSTTTAINGSNLTLTNGVNSTALTAGGATFTGDAGEKGGKVTTINGGTITTDTLNVERINLGEDILDSNGTPHGSNLSMDKQGNFSAAGGNFKVVGGTGADKGAFTNTVGNTTLQTDTTGASMNYAGTANSNISVADGKAEMTVGANAAVTATDGKVEIKGGTQTVTTTDAGTVFANGSSAVRPGGVTTTTINGNEIITGKLTTDQLVITGSGAAGGAGTIALGGDGSITSNIKDAATGKEATFKTNAEGTFTHAKDGANETTNTVNAQGNTNVVTDGTNTSTATQKATSIGGVVTNGTVTMKQELTVDGVKFEQTDYDEVNIAKGDVTVKNNRNTATPNQEVHLSDLGSLNNLDGELKARDEYKNNETAVGAINAEAAIRREEVARLDNRIDDVNNRVDKVGAMAAAIASLKSIGYDPQAPSEFSIGLGQYKGETGVAMGFFHYPNKNFMINVSLSTAGGETMGGIGATWRFGHKSPQKLLDEQREAQARKELAAAEKYQAAAKLAKEAQERAEYAAKLARQAQVSADNAKAAADATQAKHFQ